RGRSPCSPRRRGRGAPRDPSLRAFRPPGGGSHNAQWSGPGPHVELSVPRRQPMIDDSLRHVIEAQQARIVRLRAVDPPELVPLIQRALHPDEIRQALLRESPVLRHRRELGTGRPDPVELREEAAAAGVLEATPHDLAYRRLFPSLDLGVYAACHSTGKPSVAWEAALHEHLSKLTVKGLTVFSEGGWAEIVERFRARIGELV